MQEEQNPIQTTQTTGMAGELSSPTDLFKKSFELYKAGFKKFIGIMLLPVLGALPFFVILIFLPGIMVLGKSSGGIVVLWLLSALFAVVVAIISQAGLYILIKDASKI